MEPVGQSRPHGCEIRQLRFCRQVVYGQYVAERRSGRNCPIVGACVAATTSGTSIGWTAGAGMEWKFSRNWSAKAEYLYVDLGKHAATGVTLPMPFCRGHTRRAQISGSALRASA
jgi:opacity protein-like surface antigen